jgi:hypothetical protein
MKPLSIIAALLIAGSAYAGTKVQFEQPILTQNGSPLTNLAYFVVAYTTGNQVPEDKYNSVYVLKYVDAQKPAPTEKKLYRVYLPTLERSDGGILWFYAVNDEEGKGKVTYLLVTEDYPAAITNVQ